MKRMGWRKFIPEVLIIKIEIVNLEFYECDVFPECHVTGRYFFCILDDMRYQFLSTGSSVKGSILDLLHDSLDMSLYSM